MRKNLLALAFGFALLGGFLAVGAFVVDRFVHSPEDLAFRSTFREIAPGTEEARVIQLLGPPDERSQSFFLGQEIGYEDAYQRAAASSSSHFLVWRRLDLVYSVGFDASGKVTLAEVGGT